jgi:hypothetical protein
VQGLIERVRERFPQVELQEVNLIEHPGLAVRYGVFSTPALAINGRLEFTGVPKEHKLLERLNALAGSG